MELILADVSAASVLRVAPAAAEPEAEAAVGAGEGTASAEEGAASRTRGRGHVEHRLVSPTARFDTVIMNPPFGTRIAGIDMVFLQRGIEACADGGAVYSLHKSSTREHIVKTAARLRCSVEVFAELKFVIPRMYKFHRKEHVAVDVDFLRFSVNRGGPVLQRKVPRYIPAGADDGLSRSQRARGSSSRGSGRGGGGRGRGRGRGRGGQPAKVKGAHGNRKKR